MTLTSGTKLGPYEVVSPLGAGGMGEVYRARDQTLGRDVALKVLPAAFASDPERMARFRREAQVLASLNHSRIGAIYGFEDSGSVHALVMELIEGPTLAGRIARGPVPLDEALPLAREISEALEAAHERGIVHRDLKPANIKITPDGNVKVLDFGLAKAVEGDATSTDIQNSPTISRVATQAGIILGTAAYMSPEQAKGKQVDRRTDIWAFGCVLFEMLTATRPFEGETASDALAAVIRAEPNWALLRSTTPQAIRSLLQRCLKKDPKQRLQAIGDARIAIEEILSGTPSDASSSVSEAHARRLVPWAIAAAALIVAGLFAAGYFVRKPQPLPAIVSQIASPPNTKFVFNGINPGPPVLSPDGGQVAFSAAGSDGRQLLWIRPLNHPAAHPLEGTDGAMFPFWSADSRSLGFFTNGKMNRIDLAGGPPVGLCDIAIGRGGTWGADGTILFTPNVSSPVFRIAASGGTPQPVTMINGAENERSHRWPQFLPDNKHFLFFAQKAVVGNGGVYVASLDGGAPKLLMQNESNAVYSTLGYLLFVRQGNLMVQRFDASHLRLDGEAVALVEHVGVNAITSRAIFDVSGTGILVYEAGNATGDTDQLVWYDRTGKQIEATGTTGLFVEPSISADGSKLAISGLLGGTRNGLSIWLFDLARATKTRLTFPPASDRQPSWAPDGKSLAFVSNLTGPPHIYLSAADGTGTPTSLTAGDVSEFAPRFTADGRYLLFERLAEQPNSRREIWGVLLSGDRKAFPVIQNQFDSYAPALSPDGKWLAYESREGRPEICVIPFLHGAGKWQVSTAGGLQPRWRRDGRELFYISTDNKIMAAEITEQQSSLLIGKVQSLFQIDPVRSAGGSPYDVTADGKKFVVASVASSQGSEPLTLVVKWPALLTQK
jgi:serine/threonine protein kinase